MSQPSIDEYKELRKEITFLADSIGKFYTSSLSVSIALLAGLGAFILKDNGTNTPLSPVAPYLFLAPPFIAISVLFLLASHRKDLHRVGSYVQVFHEESGAGPGWECRLMKFRALSERLESLDGIPGSFWIVQLLSAGLYLMAVEKAGPINLCHLPWPMLEGLLLVLAHIRYHNALADRETYYRRWKCVKKQEGDEETHNE